MNPILSIIIPCFNSSEFIRTTLDSLLMQDISDCEIIAINDGSTDNTLEILSEYKNKGVRVLTHSNQVVSYSRNRGIEEAKGEYVYFIDSDDCLTSGSIEFFKKCISEYPEMDMQMFGYKKEKNGNLIREYSYSKYNSTIFSGIDGIRLYCEKELCFHICSMIIKRKLLISDNLKFPNGIKIGEDNLFYLNALRYSEKAMYHSRICFIYQLRDDGAMKGYKSYSLDQDKSYRLIKEFLLNLLNDNPILRPSIHYFIKFWYLTNLFYYLKSDVRENAINQTFIEDKVYFKHYDTREPNRYRRIMNVFKFFPLKAIFKICKH